MLPSAQRTASASAGGSIRAQSHGLCTPCLRFAVWVTPGPRKTRFWLLASFARWGWKPTGSHYKVSGCLGHPSSSSRLAWRTLCDPLIRRRRLILCVSAFDCFLHAPIRFGKSWSKNHQTDISPIDFVLQQCSFRLRLADNQEDINGKGYS